MNLFANDPKQELVARPDIFTGQPLRRLKTSLIAASANLQRDYRGQTKLAAPFMA